MKAGLALLGWAATLAGPAQAESTAQPVIFAGPDQPVLVSRSLVRLLSDGKTITATRTYRITFHREGAGWQVDGTLVDVQVDAPPVLAQLAAIERSRAEPGMFPIRLDRAGRIVPQAVSSSGEARTRAAAMAELMMAGAIKSPAARSEASAMLTQISAAAGSGTAWPADLFNPTRSVTSEQRELALPDGSRGSVEIVLTAHGTQPGRLPERVERVVTTRLSGTERVSREIWTMTKAGR